MAGKDGKDPASGVLTAVKQDVVTGGIAVGSVAAFMMIPVVGTFVGIAGVAWLGLRAVKRGMKKKG